MQRKLIQGGIWEHVPYTVGIQHPILFYWSRYTETYTQEPIYCRCGNQTLSKGLRKNEERAFEIQHHQQQARLHLPFIGNHKNRTAFQKTTCIITTHTSSAKSCMQGGSNKEHKTGSIFQKGKAPSRCMFSCVGCWGRVVFQCASFSVTLEDHRGKGT